MGRHPLEVVIRVFFYAA
ncbi:KEX1 protease [Kluyveromyces marxianus]|uniref:KEX1 protease n=1 Tax=Kluyveromyces marxianus TaxID=4911 RepID=A0ABX6F3J2_KLUMA|nr:KEX1 protease [Kluyveromyces marxianus]